MTLAGMSVLEWSELRSQLWRHGIFSKIAWWWYQVWHSIWSACPLILYSFFLAPCLWWEATVNQVEIWACFSRVPAADGFEWIQSNQVIHFDRQRNRYLSPDSSGGAIWPGAVYLYSIEGWWQLSSTKVALQQSPGGICSVLTLFCFDLLCLISTDDKWLSVISLLVLHYRRCLCIDTTMYCIVCTYTKTIVSHVLTMPCP